MVKGYNFREEKETYTGKSSGFQSEMAQSMSSNVNQRSLSSLKAAGMWEHTLLRSVGLDSERPKAGISPVYNQSCPISPSTHHGSLNIYKIYQQPSNH